MNDLDILHKAFQKVHANGYPYGQFDMVDWQRAIDTKSYYSEIFTHDFAKAFWGEEVDEFFGCPKWQAHLQQMVLEENPLQYLAKFLA